MDRMPVVVGSDLLVETNSMAVLVFARGRATGFHSASIHSVAESIDWSGVETVAGATWPAPARPASPDEW